MIEIKSNFSFGQKVKDSTTGMEGVIVAISKWKNGCIRMAVQPQMKEGAEKVPESVWVDEMDLHGYEPAGEKLPGGPRTVARRHDEGSSR